MLKFRPPLWAVVLTMLTVALFGALAHWQYQRGQDKADIIARRSSLSESPTVTVNAPADLPEHGQRIQVQGYWHPEREVLLDNQTHDGQIGVHVWTPLRLADTQRLLLVNRGWLNASPYREQLPDTGELPSEQVTIGGLWRDLPQAGLATDTGVCREADGWPQRLNYPSHDTLNCLYSNSVQDGLLLLDPRLPHGFVREWADLGIPPERHYGYAVQWAALLLTALVLFVVLNLKRS